MTSAPDPHPSTAHPALVGEDRAAVLRADSAGWSDLVLTGEQVAAVALLGMGVLPPLRGFMDGVTAAAVSREGRMPDGTSFPGPVVLHGPADAAVGGMLALRDAEGDLLAAMTVTEVFPYREGHALAGTLEVVSLPVRYDLAALWRTPAVFAVEVGEGPVVVTDRPLDSGQLAAVGRGAHVLALAGEPRPGAVDPVTLVRALQASDVASVTLVPRPPGGTVASWAPLLAAAYGRDELPVGGHSVISDADLITALTSGVVPGPPTFPESTRRALQRRFPPPDRVGFTVLLSGLSGSGKSTVARALAASLEASGDRRVTLLDGDLVRTNLSSELGFSRAHRELNVSRIGYVASEVTRHGGIAICAPIAPHAAVRARVREMVESTGRFVLVHVATPLEVCEARDRKGLYAKARAGLIPEFTGISDPYETPEDAEVVIDTTTGTPSDAVDRIRDWLEAAGLIGG